MFFLSTTNIFSLLNMPEMVLLYGSVKEIWESVDESYVLPAKDQITIRRKTDTYMSTLLTKLLQSQFIVNLNDFIA